MKIYAEFSRISALTLNRLKSTLSFPLGLPDVETCEQLKSIGFDSSNITTDIKYLGYTLKNGEFQESVDEMINSRTEKI